MNHKPMKPSPKQVLAVRISPDLRAALEAQALEMSLTLSELVCLKLGSADLPVSPVVDKEPVQNLCTHKEEIVNVNEGDIITPQFSRKHRIASMPTFTQKSKLPANTKTFVYAEKMRAILELRSDKTRSGGSKYLVRFTNISIDDLNVQTNGDFVYGEVIDLVGFYRPYAHM